MPEPAGEHVADWRLILNTADAAKVARLLKRLEETLGVPVETIDIKPYWKQPGTTEALVRTGLEHASPAEAVFEILLCSSRLAPGWQTSGPSLYDGGRWDFELFASSGFSVPGITFAAVRVKNFGQG